MNYYHGHLPFHFSAHPMDNRTIKQLFHDRRRVYNYIARSLYGEQLERLLRHFPREQILIVHQLDMRQSAAATLRRITDFIGVPPLSNEQLPSDILNQEIPPVISQTDIDYLNDQFADDMKLLSQLTSGNVTFAPYVQPVMDIHERHRILHPKSPLFSSPTTLSSSQPMTSSPSSSTVAAVVKHVRAPAAAITRQGPVFDDDSSYM